MATQDDDINIDDATQNMDEEAMHREDSGSTELEESEDANL